jgi:hypothetical protein
MPDFPSLRVITSPGDSTGVGTIVFNADGTGVSTLSPAFHKQGNNILHDKMTIPVNLIATSITAPVFICREGTWVVDSVAEYHQTGSTSGTLNLTVETGSTAPGVGTAQVVGTVPLTVAAQQVVQGGVVLATPTEIGPGARLSVLLAGTLTGLVNGAATISLRRVR